ncbi:hypothetical protein DHW03_05650 [Pedobacter yonginense]|uniref:YD repeat-containing protein n=1 Tax=Pedobacter yonginense TaxID=651869 RepID=A0A317EQY2_9SPHI|nr:RHS repeat domain-containing protein [Pedobacter yonginense]PWS29301.1 hypothetical protein DHW03_05650 [Pedobacter yonginense]
MNYKFDYDSTKVFTPGLIIRNIAPNQGGLITSMTEYKLRGYWKKYSITNETLIDKNTFKELSTSDTLFYTSPYHRSVTRKASTKSTGSNLATNFKYVFDFIPTFATSMSDGWDTYQSSCKSCDAIYSQRISTSGITTGGKKLAWFKRRICLLNARKNYVDYRRTNFMDPSNVYANAHLSAKNNADAAFKPILEMQDQFINAPIETTSWVNGKLASANFNSFSIQPRVESLGWSIIPNVFLNSINSIKLTIPLSASFQPSGNSNSTITKDSRYTPDYFYNSFNGRIVEQNKDGQPKDVYLWGYNQKYPVAKISNSDYNTAKQFVNQAILSNPASDAQLREELKKLYINLPNAQISTYTYKPLVGMTSQTDAKGMTTYYEYDAFGRLKYVKDQNGNIVKSNDYHYKN